MLSIQMQDYMKDMLGRVLKVIPLAEFEKIAADDIAVSACAIQGDTMKESVELTLTSKRRLNRLRVLASEMSILICIIQTYVRAKEEDWRVTQPTMYEILGRLLSDEDFCTGLIMDDRETPPEIAAFLGLYDEDEEEDEEFKRGNAGDKCKRRGWR